MENFLALGVFKKITNSRYLKEPRSIKSKVKGTCNLTFQNIPLPILYLSRHFLMNKLKVYTIEKK